VCAHRADVALVERRQARVVDRVAIAGISGAAGAAELRKDALEVVLPFAAAAGIHEMLPRGRLRSSNRPVSATPGRSTTPMFTEDSEPR
jgi:hypothetical protein